MPGILVWTDYWTKQQKNSIIITKNSKYGTINSIGNRMRSDTKYKYKG